MAANSAGTDELTRCRQAIRELERSNRELEQFARIASHDLREPLRTIASYLSLIERECRGRLGADTDKFIGIAVDGAHRMSRMLSELHAYARVADGGQRFQAVDCAEIASEVIASLELLVGEAGARIRLGELPRVLGERVLLELLFRQLLENALKFRAERAPEIVLSGEITGEQVRFRVRDNGIGIPSSQQERIFEPFQRLHPRDVYPGSGLGLSLCQRIVEHHGGQIAVQSSPGEGSEFAFTLPRAPASTAPEHT